MRVLFVHNRYQQPGGEDRAVELEAGMLEEKGHSVKVLFFDNRDIKDSGIKKIIALKNLLHNSDSAVILRNAILEFKPDIIHVHNLFFVASPAILEEACRLRIPLVLTLHNYRLICCNALLLRENRPCEICIKKDLPLAGIRYACYRNSGLASAAVMLSTGLPKLRRQWRRWVENYIVLTPFAKEKFEHSSLGAAPQQLVIKPNFVHDPGFSAAPREAFFLFAGRLSPEKGIHFLLEAFKNMPDKKLRIAGDGPERNELAARYQLSHNIEFLGKRNPGEILDLMKKSLALVFPSIWYEGLPYVILEAFSTGTPVLASDLGAMHSMVKDGYNGILFKPASAAHIQSAVLQFAEHAPNMYQQARDTYLNHYHPDKHFQSIMEIYENSIRNYADRIK
jgi:glycosyltransferase involved in cell wall biosynthesis